MKTTGEGQNVELSEVLERSWRPSWMRGGRDAQRGSSPAGVVQLPTGREEPRRELSLDQRVPPQERPYWVWSGREKRHCFVFRCGEHPAWWDKGWRRGRGMIISSALPKAGPLAA